MRADDILTQIDEALHDGGIGPDAMRWTPEPPGQPQQRFTVVHVDTAVLHQRLRALNDSLHRMTEAMQPSAAEAAKAMAAFVQAMQKRPAGDGRPAWHSPYGPAQRRR